MENVAASIGVKNTWFTTEKRRNLDEFLILYPLFKNVTINVKRVVRLAPGWLKDDDEEMRGSHGS